MNIQPLSNNVLIKPLKEDKKTKGGIFLPENAEKEKPQRGTVIEVGPGKRNNAGIEINVPVHPGDEVIFNMYGPHEIKIDGEDYLIANENDILAIIKKEDKN